MKWHANLYRGISTALEWIIHQNQKAEHVLNRLFTENKKWGKKDRTLVSGTVYDILRKLNLYQELTQYISGPRDKTEKILIAYLCLKNHIPEFIMLDEKICPTIKQKAKELETNPIYKTGLPEWIYKEGEKTWKAEWLKIALSLNQPAKPVLRINTLKIQPEKFKKIFYEKGYGFKETGLEEAIVLEKSYRLTNTIFYRKGWFEFQDLSSQKAGKFIAPGKGDKVFDACAGAGGKTLQLAALMNNTGEIYAADISRAKLNVLKDRAKRAGVTNIKNIFVPGKNILENYRNYFDIVVVDAPCSGSGTYKRKPDLKWKWNPERFQQTIHLQKDILDIYSETLKPGGKLIYITCSVLGKENREQVKHFLERNKSFTFVKDMHLRPDTDRFDGFYMAKLLKNA